MCAGEFYNIFSGTMSIIQLEKRTANFVLLIMTHELQRSKYKLSADDLLYYWQDGPHHFYSRDVDIRTCLGLQLSSWKVIGIGK